VVRIGPENSSRPTLHNRPHLTELRRHILRFRAIPAVGCFVGYYSGCVCGNISWLVGLVGLAVVFAVVLVGWWAGCHVVYSDGRAGNQVKVKRAQ
jgi:hypothetical protein